jgi:inositol phosphorylceramide synthase catalytic subunit
MPESAAMTVSVDRQSPQSVASVPVPIWRTEAVRFALIAAPFLATAVAYEGLRLLAPLHGRIRVAELRELEQLLFSFGGGKTLSDLVANAYHPLLDVICGVTYLLFMAEVVALSIYYFFTDRLRALSLSLGFFVVNIVGWLLWLAYPAAPPWYADLHGLGPVSVEAASNPAALVRVDATLGIPLFATIYAQSAFVFGAIPSLHASYATLAALVSFRRGGLLRTGTLVFLVLIAYSAMYLRHHYFVDVVAGILLAIIVHFSLTHALCGRARGIIGHG